MTTTAYSSTPPTTNAPHVPLPSSWFLTAQFLPQDLLKWATYYPYGDDGNHEEQTYLSANVYQDSIDLVLEARADNMGNPTRYPNAPTLYTSGMIASWNIGNGTNVQTSGMNANWPNGGGMSYKWGYIECLMETPVGHGLWPAFWQLMQRLHTVGEIDQLEKFSDWPSYVSNAVNAPSPGYDIGQKTLIAGVDTGFHAYGLLWTSSALQFYCDGVLTYTLTDPSLIPPDEMYVLINLALGGATLPAIDGSTPFPCQVRVKYVRLWQPLDGTITLPGTATSVSVSTLTHCTRSGANPVTVTPARQILAAFAQTGHAISEFISGDYRHNGMCTEAALECCVAAIERRAPSQEKMLAYALDMIRRGWCNPNGGSTLANIAHYARYVLGQQIAVEWDYQEPLSQDWLDVLRKQAGVRPILMQVAHGANLIDAETHVRPEAAVRGLRYHAIAIVGKQETIPGVQQGGYLVADGDSPQVTTRLQIYDRATLAAAVPCGLLMLDMPAPKPTPPPIIVPPPAPDPSTRYKAALAQIQMLATQALKG